MRDYTWTASDLPALSARADAVEVAGVADLGETFERTECSTDAALWSVYLHMPDQGAQCVADRNTRQEALSVARSIAERLSVPLHTY